jgi:hypothetical protein
MSAPCPTSSLNIPCMAVLACHNEPSIPFAALLSKSKSTWSLMKLLTESRSPRLPCREKVVLEEEVVAHFCWKTGDLFSCGVCTSVRSFLLIDSLRSQRSVLRSDKMKQEIEDRVRTADGRKQPARILCIVACGCPDARPRSSWLSFCFTVCT